MKTADLFELSNELLQQRQPHAWITVIAVKPPSSAYVGAQAIVTSDGQLHGWIGGGCVQSTARSEALGSLTAMAPRRLRLGNTTEGFDDVDVRPMNCPSNGEIELFIQPIANAPVLRIYGNTPVAKSVAWMAREADFEPLTDAEADDLASAGGSLPAQTYALIATQGDGDEAALESALRSSARDVLVIASKTKAERLRAVMALRGIPESRIAAIQAPAGPDIGAVTPNEVALAAVAGLVALRRARKPDGTRCKGANQPSADPVNRANVVGYVNPVCGAVVDPARALSTVSLSGQTHYFCCNGCRTEFDRDPQKYLAIAAHMRTPATVE